MYPYPSYQVLKVLQEERNMQAEDIRQYSPLSQPLHPPVRSLALTLGHALILLGTRLEHIGQ